MDPILYQAVISGDFRFFQNLNTENQNILFQVTSQRNNILHLATKFKHKQIVEKIIHSFSSLLYLANSKGDLPLHIAARFGCTDIIELLINYKSGINREDVEGFQQLLKMGNLEMDTALHDAVRNGHFGAAKLLIEADPELTCYVNNYGESPLFLAVDKRYFNIAGHILQYAPSCSCEGRNKMNVLHAAIIRTSNGNQVSSLIDIWVQCNNHPSRFFYETLTTAELTWKRLREKFCNQVKDKLCYTGLNIEADVINAIIRQWPDAAREVDEWGWTPLHYAAHFGHTKAVALLLNDNMQIAFMKDLEGMSALHIAAKEGHVKVMKELVAFCPEACELLDNCGRTALHVAVENGKASVVKYLLKMPAHALEGLINEQDEEGNTALHIAALHGHLEIIKMLADDERVEKGAINKKGLAAIEVILSKMELRHFQKAWITKKLANCGGQPSLKGLVFRQTTKTKVLELNGYAQNTEGKKDSNEHDLVNNTQESRKEKEKNNVAIDGRLCQDQGESEDKSVCIRVKDVANTHLLVATIIATVAFTAGFQMPGGVDQGMAISSKKLAFKAFMISDTIAFCCSAASMLLHFWASNERNCSVYLHFMRFASALTYNSIIGMVIAFISGTNVVFAESSWLAILNLAFGCSFFTIFSVWFFR